MANLTLRSLTDAQLDVIAYARGKYGRGYNTASAAIGRVLLEWRSLDERNEDLARRLQDLELLVGDYLRATDAASEAMKGESVALAALLKHRGGEVARYHRGS